MPTRMMTVDEVTDALMERAKETGDWVSGEYAGESVWASPRSYRDLVRSAVRHPANRVCPQGPGYLETSLPFTADWLPEPTPAPAATEFDPTKPPHRTKEGYTAEIVATDLDGETPIAAIITAPDGRKKMRRYGRDGRWAGHGSDILDLVNVPERHVRWVNVYPGEAGGVTREEADATAAPNRIACIRVEFEAGEGLS